MLLPIVFVTVFISFCSDFAAFSVVVAADAVVVVVVVEWIHCIKSLNAKPLELKIFSLFSVCLCTFRFVPKNVRFVSVVFVIWYISHEAFKK